MAMFKLDRLIRRCTPKPDAIRSGNAYMYDPVPDGVNPAYLSVVIAGTPYKRDANKPILVYDDSNPADPQLLHQLTVEDFEANFDFES